MADKRLLRELRGFGKDPGPLSDSSRRYWKRELQLLKRSSDDGRGKRMRKENIGFSSDEEDGDSRRNVRTGERMSQHAVRRKRSDKLPVKVTGGTAPAHSGQSSPHVLHVIGAFLGFAIVFGYAAVLRVQEDSVEAELRRLDNFLPCTPDTPREETCLLDSNLETALEMSYFVAEYLSLQAGDYDCLIGGIRSRNVSMRELKIHVFRTNEDRGWSVTHLSHVLQLFFANPHWGIQLYDSNNSVVSNMMDADVEEVKYLESQAPLKSFSCRMVNALSRLQSWLFYVLAGVTLVIMLGFAMWLYQKHLWKQEEEMFSLVKHILELIERQGSENQKRSGKKAYIAQQHVRDKLIPPTQRKGKQRVWEKAVAWLAENESRIRVEQQRVAGEDVFVWRWIGSEETDSNDEQIEDERDISSLR